MMYGEDLALDAAALSRRASGLSGRYDDTSDISPVLAAALYPQSAAGYYGNATLGASLEDKLGKAGIDASVTFLQSGGDVDSLYEPLFKTLQVLAHAVPSPGDLLVSAGVSGVKIGTDAIRDAIKTVLRSSGKYLPIEASRAVNKEIMMPNSTLTWWGRAAKDKFAQYAGTSLPVTLAVSAYNGSVDDKNKLDLNVHSRLADALYALALKNKAKEYQAAMAAYEVAKNTGADSKVTDRYASLVGDRYKPQDAWKLKVQDEGGQIFTQQDIEDYASGKRKPPKTGMSKTTLYALGAVGLVGAALLLTKPKAK